MQRLVLSLLFLVTIGFAANTPNFLGAFPIYSVAFLGVDRYNSTLPYQLVASGIGVLSGDGLYNNANIAASLSNVNQTQVSQITQNIKWPNEIHLVPQGYVKNAPYALSLASGFLVPEQSTGAITLIPQNPDSTWGTPVQVSTDKDSWFYHRVRWYDVNGDGLNDIVTCRAYKPTFGSAGGELLWLEQPANGILTAPWTEHVIAEGPDVFFEFINVNDDEIPEIVAAEFFTNQQVTLLYTTTTWADSSNIFTVVIDDTIDNAFDVKVVDLDLDGFDEIVATNHESDPTKSAVIAYEIPKNWKSDPWPRHVLATGFVVTEGGFNQATPGSAWPFYPALKANTRPWIFIDGDGSQKAYQLRPIDGKRFEYELTIVVDTGATVGAVALADVDGDGFTEVFIPAYDTGLVYVYTYAPTY